MPSRKARKVLVGGVFSILHPGHMLFLESARKLGSSLVVVIAHDRTVQRRKGKPPFTAKDRARMVASLKLVDRVRIGDPYDMMKAVREEKPGIIALGYDQGIDERKLRQELESMGLKTKVVRIRKRLPGYSTSKIIKEIKERND